MIALLGRQARIGVRFEPRDLWVGVYWNLTRHWYGEPYRIAQLDVYVCLLPTLPIKLELYWRCGR